MNSSTLVPFGNGSNVLVAWDSANSSLTMAFATSAGDNSSLTQQVSDLTAVEYLSDVFGGNPPSANPIALQLFQSVIGNATGQDGAVQSITGGELHHYLSMCDDPRAC